MEHVAKGVSRPKRFYSITPTSCKEIKSRDAGKVLRCP